MGFFEKVKIKAEELLGRAEQVYGESHGDAAATVGGEARLLEAEAEEDALEAQEHDEEHGRDDGLTGTR